MGAEMANEVRFESEPKDSEHRFYIRKADPGDMVEYLARKFSEEYETQAVVVSDDEAFAQIRKTGKWRALLGLQQNITVRVHVSDSGTLVEIGKAVWADKAAALGIGWIFSLGLPFLTAPWGIYSQHQARRRAWALVEYRMADQPAL